MLPLHTIAQLDPDLFNFIPPELMFSFSQLVNGQTNILDDHNLYQSLYEYFLDVTREMPYNVAKARDGDPYEWIVSKLEETYYVSIIRQSL